MKNIKGILLIVFLAILDQFTKFYFFGRDIYFNYFSLKFVENTGVLFGFFKGNNTFFIFLSILVVCFLSWLYYREVKYRFVLIFVIAGAFGNLIDRIFRGYVVDFLDFRIWPVFNLADAFIVIGVVLLIYLMIKEKD